MRQREAFEFSLSVARTRGWGPNREDPLLGSEHAEDMLRRWDDSFSEAKAGRWLGWLQGVLCAQYWLTLDECKEINHNHSDDPDPLSHDLGSAPGG